MNIPSWKNEYKEYSGRDKRIQLSYENKAEAYKQMIKSMEETK